MLRGADQDATPLFGLENKTEVTRQLSANGIEANGEQRLFISQEFNMFGSLFNDYMDYTVGIFVSNETIDDTISGQFLGFGGYLGDQRRQGGFGGGVVSAVPPILVGFQGVYVANFENTSAAIFAQSIFSSG